MCTVARYHVFVGVVFFFFFKQKTAYEMRISDWSSDVLLFRSLAVRRSGRAAAPASRSAWRMGCGAPRGAAHGVGRAGQDDPETVRKAGRFGTWHAPALRNHVPGRSEEHTSELQSLMRISYAVFCLKKKITQT